MPGVNHHLPALRSSEGWRLSLPSNHTVDPDVAGLRGALATTRAG